MMTDQAPRKRRSRYDYELIEKKKAKLTEMAQVFNDGIRRYYVDFSDRPGDDRLDRWEGFYLCWHWEPDIFRQLQDDPDLSGFLRHQKHELQGDYLGQYYKDALADLKEKIAAHQAKQESTP